jgi:hypothetical protein
MTEIPVLIEGEEIYIEVADVYGAQKTGVGSKFVEGTEQAFDRAMNTIGSVSRQLVATVGNLKEASRPEEFSLEFGVKFKLDGKVVIASTSGEASLVVKMLYKPNSLHEGASDSGDTA